MGWRGCKEKEEYQFLVHCTSSVEKMDVRKRLKIETSALS
jgi:hypothetical protein